jgi:hypothetical protein
MSMDEEEMMALAEVSFAEEYLRQIELINLKFSEKVRVFKGPKIRGKRTFFCKFYQKITSGKSSSSMCRQYEDTYSAGSMRTHILQAV